jgi:hypothetical protein
MTKEELPEVYTSIKLKDMGSEQEFYDLLSMMSDERYDHKMATWEKARKSLFITWIATKIYEEFKDD